MHQPDREYSVGRVGGGDCVRHGFADDCLHVLGRCNARQYAIVRVRVAFIVVYRLKALEEVVCSDIGGVFKFILNLIALGSS